MKNTSVCLLFTLLFCSIYPTIIFAHGIASSTGLLETVSSDGPFDAMRSPATLSSMKTDNVFGVSVNYDLTNNYKTSGSVSFTGFNDASYSVKDPNYSFWNVLAAYETKLAKETILGLAIGVKNSSLEYDRSLTLQKNPPQDVYDQNINTKTNAFDLNASLCQNISNEISAGLKLHVNHSLPNSNSTLSHSWNSRETESEELEINTKYTTADLSLGLMYKKDNTQIGVNLLLLGLSQITNSKEYKYSDNNNANNSYNVDDMNTNGNVITRRPELAVGLHQRISTLFAFAAEGGLIFENQYKLKQLYVVDRKYQEFDTKYIYASTYFIKIGGEFNITNDITFALGGVYSPYEYKINYTLVNSNKNKSYFTEKNKFDRFILTLGGEYKVDKTLSLALFAETDFYNQKWTDYRKYTTSREEYTSKLDATETYLGFSVVKSL